MYNYFFLVLLMFLLSACSSDNSDNSTTSKSFIGNTSMAIGFALVDSSSDLSANSIWMSDSSNGSFTISSSDPLQGCKNLVKIVTNPITNVKTESVFSDKDCKSVDVVSFVATSNHLVIKGLFNNIADANGNSINCHLIALPLDLESATAICIETEALGGRTSSNGQQWGVGLKGLSDTIYYSVATTSGTKIKKWSGGSSVETLFTSSVGSFNEIYSTNGYSFLFFRMNPSVGSDGSYFYGDLTNGFNLVDSFRVEPIKFDKKLFLVPDPNAHADINKDFKKMGSYDLETGKHISHLSSGLEACNAPNYGSNNFPIQLQWQSNTFTYWLGFYGFSQGGTALCKIDSEGIASVVDNTYKYERGWRSNNIVLLLSKDGTSPVLTKLDLATDTYITANLLQKFSLLEVSKMREYLQGVALTGIDTFGNLVTVFYNSTTDTIELTPSESTQFSRVVYLK